MPSFDRLQRRILGVLFEKKTTTPEQYPLTVPALVAGCNQKSNRNPPMELAQWEVEGGVRGLLIDGWVREVVKAGARASRYEERFTDRLELDRPSAAVLVELFLRGPSTANELHTRAARMADLPAGAEWNALLEKLAEEKWIELLPRAPGQREARWMHRVAPPNEAPEVAEEHGSAAAPEGGPSPSGRDRGALEARVEALEQEISKLRDALEELRASLG